MTGYIVLYLLVILLWFSLCCVGLFKKDTMTGYVVLYLLLVVVYYLTK